MSVVVVVADADLRARADMAHALSDADYKVVESPDGVHALRQVFAEQAEAIVMDFNMPLLSGLELIRVLRTASDLAIVVVSANPTPAMAARVLDAGADDYVAKPLFMPELLARLRSTMRRLATNEIEDIQDQEVVRTGPLTINRDRHVVTLRGEPVVLTRTEQQLLDAMARRVGHMCPHRYLLAAVWGEEYVDDTHYLRSYIASLRAKLEDDPARPRLLLTEWGTGYRLAAMSPDAEGEPAKRIVAS
jgi:two-component system KDP operon response regulator KdpE